MDGFKLASTFLEKQILFQGVTRKDPTHHEVLLNLFIGVTHRCK